MSKKDYFIHDDEYELACVHRTGDGVYILTEHKIDKDAHNDKHDSNAQDDNSADNASDNSSKNTHNSEIQYIMYHKLRNDEITHAIINDNNVNALNEVFNAGAGSLRGISVADRFIDNTADGLIGKPSGNGSNQSEIVRAALRFYAIAGYKERFSYKHVDIGLLKTIKALGTSRYTMHDFLTSLNVVNGGKPPLKWDDYKNQIIKWKKQW